MDPTSRSLFLAGESEEPAVPGPPIGDHFYQAKYSRTGYNPNSHVFDTPFFDTGLDLGEIIPHEKVYNIPCNTQWVCPAGVTNVCVLGVGGGGGGVMYGPGGGGGGLFYRNNVSVTPGTSYTIEVGQGGWPGNTQQAGQDGYSTRVDMPNYSIAKGGNGGAANPGYAGAAGGSGGNYIGTTSGGGNGGNGGSSSARGNGWNSGGGGGAAGYSGNGGNGGNSNQSSASSGGSGSGGGGGGGSGGVDLTAQGYGFGGEGGGVGLFGQGSSGAGGSNTNAVGTNDPKVGVGGDGGSGGTDGGDKFSWDVPGTHGGGGSGGYVPGGHGAVRIVYSVTGRTNPSFPNNAGKFSSTIAPYLWWTFTNEAFGPRWYTNGAVNETYPWMGFSAGQQQTVGRYVSLPIINGMLGAQRDPNVYTSQTTYTNRKAYAQAFKPGTGFMDLVSWDGNSSSTRQISHSLGSTPGFIRIFTDSGASRSVCLHDDGTTQRRCDWSTSLGAASDGVISATSDIDFTVSTTNDRKNVNKTGNRYTAAVFANNDTVRCGSWLGTGGSQNIDLGMTNGCQAIWIYDMGNTTWYHISAEYDGYYSNTLGSSYDERYATFSANTLSSDQIMSASSGGFQLIHGTLFNTSGTRYLYVAFSA